MIDRRNFLKNVLPACVATSAARALAQSDGCAGVAPPEHLFSTSRSMSLQNLPASEVVQLTVDTAGYIYAIVRNPESAVRQYDPKGRMLRRFGGYGRADGQFVMPMGICCDSERKLYVLDLSLGRIQVFGQGGLCEHRISMLSDGLQAWQVVCRTSGALYVASVAATATAPLAHRIDLNGRILSSFYPTDGRVQTHNLWAIASGMVALGADGSVYAGQRVSPTIGKFSPEGMHLLDIGARPPCYVEPPSLPRPSSVDRSELDRLLRRFTTLDNVLMFGGNIVALSFRLAGESPRWLLELYGADGQPKGKPAQFDTRPAATDLGRVLYCRAPSAGNGRADVDLRIYSMV